MSHRGEWRGSSALGITVEWIILYYFVRYVIVFTSPREVKRTRGMTMASCFLQNDVSDGLDPHRATFYWPLKYTFMVMKQVRLIVFGVWGVWGV